MRYSIVLPVLAALVYGCVSSPSDDEPSASTEAPITSSDNAVLRGAFAFHDRKLAGLNANGRSCADCHVDIDFFQLKPSTVEARYQALLARRASDPTADDPLFRPIDADDFRINGQNASDYSELRQNGLIRITFNLPPNVKLVGRDGNVTGETFVDVWRSVPSVLNVKLTGPDGQLPVWPRGPNTQGGYQLDARVDTLQNQALGALMGHAQAGVAPPQSMLDDIAKFEQVLFSSYAVKSLSKAVDDGVTPLPDIDGPLTATEQAGKVAFNRSCAFCHGGPGMTTPFPGPPPVRYNGILSGCARPVDQASPPRWQFKACPPRLARNIRMYEITMADGTVVRRASDDPGRFLLTGVTNKPFTAPFGDDWDKFDNAPLRGISKTAPYFHNNSADTLEEVVDHYQALFRFVQAQSPTSPLLTDPFTGQSRMIDDADKPNIVAYLKKL